MKLFGSSRESGDRVTVRETGPVVDTRGPAPDPDAGSTAAPAPDRFAPFDTSDEHVRRAVTALRSGTPLAGPLMDFGNRPLERDYVEQLFSYGHSSFDRSAPVTTLWVTAGSGDTALESWRKVDARIDATFDQFPYVRPGVDEDSPSWTMPSSRMPAWLRTALPVLVAAAAVDAHVRSASALVGEMSDEQLATAVAELARSSRTFAGLVPLTVEVLDLQDRLDEVGKAMDALPFSDLEAAGDPTAIALRAHEASAGDALQPRFAAFAAGVVAVNTQVESLAQAERAVLVSRDLRAAMGRAGQLTELLDKVPVPGTDGVSELEAVFADMASASVTAADESREAADSAAEQLRAMRVRPSSGSRSIAD